MTTLQEALEVLRSLNKTYKIKTKTSKQRMKIVDELLGAFKGALPKGKTSTQLIRELRNTSYGRFK